VTQAQLVAVPGVSHEHDASRRLDLGDAGLDDAGRHRDPLAGDAAGVFLPGNADVALVQAKRRPQPGHHLRRRRPTLLDVQIQMLALPRGQVRGDLLDAEAVVVAAKLDR
jgi:hypothetical protein